MTFAPNEINAGPAGFGLGQEGRLRLRDGRSLSYMQFGAPEGMPLFAFHGTPGSRFMFRLSHEVAQRLGLRVIAPERPGFGCSTFQENRRLRDWPDDVGALADALHINRFAVAGISGGGPYATACAAMLPYRVTTLGLVSPMGPVQPPEGAVKIGGALHMTFRVAPKIRPALGGVFTIGRAMFLNTPGTVYRFLQARAAPADAPILCRDDVKKSLLEGVSEGLRQGIRGFVQEMNIFGSPWNIPFGEIKAPSFLWQGTSDRNVPLAAALHLADLIPNCHVSIIDNAGHYWVFDHFHEVLETLKDVMSKEAKQ